jgi:hypothetical protein
MRYTCSVATEKGSGVHRDVGDIDVMCVCREEVTR